MTTNLLERQDTLLAPIDLIEVCLLGPINDSGSLSMRRYASELADALATIERLHVERSLAPSTNVVPHSARASRSRLIRPLGYVRQRLRQVSRPISARRIHADVYHLIDQRDARLIGSLPANRTVQTVHDLYNTSNEPLSPERREQQHERFAAAGHLVAISESTRTELVEGAGIDADRVTVIPNGLDEHFRVLPAARLAVVHDALPPAAFRMLHVASNAQPRKNIGATIRVLHALRQQGLDVLLVRVGVALGDDDRRLADLLGVTGQIADRGFVSEDRLVELYNAADAMLFPSSYEGFGWPPLEAMACGLPVVASNAAALPETLGPSADATGRGGAALLAAPDDIEALTSHVAAVLTDRDLADRLRTAGFTRAREFTWDRTARAYAEVYRALLER